MLPADPEYTPRQRRRITFELLIAIALQFEIFALVGFDWVRYLFVGLMGLMFASATVMPYVFTNPFLNPVRDETDPVASSTSVVVPRWVDWLHCTFSYHTEHHLFPAMDSNSYPLVSAKLAELFPDQYWRMPILDAWRALWRSSPYATRSRRAATQ